MLFQNSPAQKGQRKRLRPTAVTGKDLVVQQNKVCVLMYAHLIGNTDILLYCL